MKGKSMDFTKSLFLIVSLSSLLLQTTNAIPLPQLPESRVLKLCKSTADPLLCFHTILPAIRGRFNPYKALEAEILATKTQVQKTSSTIDLLLANPTISKELNDSLTTCKEQYSNILDSIDEATKKVEIRDVIEARFKFSGALSYYETCKEEFTTGPPSPIVADENVVFQLAGNCLDLMKAIEDREARRNRKRGVVPNVTPAVSSPPNPCQHVIGSCNF